jgi:uncharacterized damage-inducible protein DinB
MPPPKFLAPKSPRQPLPQKKIYFFTAILFHADIGLSLPVRSFTSEQNKTLMETTTLQAQSSVINIPAFLEHWQGHRNLTRRTILAFPEDKLFSYSVGGMRPFSELVMEMIQLLGNGIHGIVSGKWQGFDAQPEKYKATTRAELLALWDEATEELNRLWPQVTPERLLEIDKAYGAWEGPVNWITFYLVDNEIHHRAQGYVYLRSLGIEPPHFWER